MYSGHIPPIDTEMGAEVEKAKQDLGAIAMNHRKNPNFRNPPAFIDQSFDQILSQFLVQCLRAKIESRFPGQSGKGKQQAIARFPVVGPDILEQVVKQHVDPYVRAAAFDPRPCVFHKIPALPKTSRFLSLNRMNDRVVGACRVLVRDRFRSVDDFDLGSAGAERYRLNQLVEMKTTGVLNATLFGVNSVNWKPIVDGTIIPAIR